ncbi:hypothetical protein PROFUN_16898 [Planoprotostelium fungivorum]|uniref:Uncharacterized protein n=1 Tax=Planoprotostelium fungivorum TaxID=1890364 RepID=A0A2P6MMX9_9EUKA|nr:hypothetical protein PROFUN_16898 [Planoprotostelium fungivorum]
MSRLKPLCHPISICAQVHPHTDASLASTLRYQYSMLSRIVVTESFRDISVFEKHNFLKETFTGYFH